MRADRLISILLLLQSSPKLTASQLSKKLEVSIRTIYRDIDALSSIGVPIYADKGVNGGIRLLGDYKTSLTGINKNELLSLLIPTSDKILADLGIENLKYQTMLKILGNSSSNAVQELENIQNYIYIDMLPWNDTNSKVNTDILTILQSAIWNTEELLIKYKKIVELKEIEIKEVKVQPLGLVCKRSIWYLVAIDSEIIKTYKTSNIEDVFILDESFIRPENFNLKDYWIQSTLNFKTLIPKYNFTFKVNPIILSQVKERPFIFIKETTTKEDFIYLKIDFESLWQGIEFAFNYGKNIEIIEPDEAIHEIKKKALQVIELYRHL